MTNFYLDNVVVLSSKMITGKTVRKFKKSEHLKSENLKFYQ